MDAQRGAAELKQAYAMVPPMLRQRYPGMCANIGVTEPPTINTGAVGAVAQAGGTPNEMPAGPMGNSTL